jgi:hypothetical protein
MRLSSRTLRWLRLAPPSQQSSYAVQLAVRDAQTLPSCMRPVLLRASTLSF